MQGVHGKRARSSSDDGGTAAAAQHCLPAHMVELRAGAGALSFSDWPLAPLELVVTLFSWPI